MTRSLPLRLANRLIPFLIALSYCLPAMEPDLRLATPMLVGVTAAVSILLAVALYLGETRRVNWTARTILLTAAVLRLLFLFRSPELSDDLYRYLWDGLQILAGHNPYSQAPADVHAHSEAMAHLLGFINHPHMVTIYPPAAQLLFAAGAFFGGVLGIKVLLTGLDLATCYLLIQLLTALRLPPWRSILYAWHPLPILEIGGSGHIDGAGLAFFFASISLLMACRSGWAPSASTNGVSLDALRRAILPAASGLVFACAVLVKFFPLVFLPGCLFCIPKQTRVFFCIGFSAGVFALCIIFLPDLKKELATLGVYARNWEFSGFLFKILRSSAISGDAARGCVSLLFFLASALFYSRFWLDKRRLERTMDLRVCSATPHTKTSKDLATDVAGRTFSLALHTFYGISLTFLLLAPTLYPWYALYLVGIFPFAAGPTGLVLAWSVFLSYQVLIPYTLLGLWVEGAWTPAVIWLAPVCSFLLSMLARRRTLAQLFWRRFHSSMPPS